MALRWGIRQINVESLPELERIAQVAKELGIKAPVALRVNPDVDAETHPYIATGLKNNKFGIETEALPQAQQILLRHRDHLHFMGFSLHIGSQILELNPLSEALIKLRKVIEDWKKQGWKFSHLDAGGGLGIFYHFFDAPKEEALAQEWQKIINQEWGALGAQLLVEPGRWLVGHYGVLLCQIEYIKKTSHHQFVIVDTGMHHLMRPALYQAEHRVLPLQKNTSRAEQVYQIVGPICESSDVIRHEVVLPEVHQGEFLAILDAGAYGSTMSSLYNQRSPALEVWWE